MPGGSSKQFVLSWQDPPPGLYPEVDKSNPQPTAPPMTAPQHEPLVSGNPAHIQMQFAPDILTRCNFSMLADIEDVG